jgi:predicted secreted protein
MWVLTAAAIIGLGTPAFGSPVVATISDSGRQVKIALHETLVVKLESKVADSGFEWELVAPGIPELKLTRKARGAEGPTTSADGDPILGGPGLDQFTFVGVKSGTTILKAEYRRFDGQTEAKFALTVTVKAAR